MKKATRLKILGFLVIPLQVLIVVFFFLYPYIKPDKYEEIVAANQEEYSAPMLEADTVFTQKDSLNVVPDSLLAPDTLSISATKYLATETEQLQLKVDSLSIALNAIELDRNKIREELDSLKNISLTSEEFLDRVKSLFNLEEDELAPILDKMTSKQLVRLYSAGSSMQREKILRSLKSDKAAKLLTEIML